MDEIKPVLVDATVAIHIDNRMHGSRYGADWIWRHDQDGVLRPQAIDTLWTEVEQLTKANIAYAGQNALLQARAERAEAEAEALRKDAERYRWLRENGKAAATGLVMRRPGTWDAAIDAAKQAAE